MKKILTSFILLSVNFEMVFAGTSGINGEYVFYLIPLLLLSLIWAGYEIKSRRKARRIAKLEAMMMLDTGENSSHIESSESDSGSD